MIRILLVVLISCLQCLAVFSSCPSGWSHFHDSCYFVSAEDGSWDDAKIICQEYGAYLAEVETFAESLYLQNHVMSLPVQHSYWIGGHDNNAQHNKDRMWSWSHSLHPFNYTDWFPGEPSYIAENCLQMRYHDGYKWNDKRCHYVSAFICEKNLVSSGPEVPALG